MTNNRSKYPMSNLPTLGRPSSPAEMVIYPLPEDYERPQLEGRFHWTIQAFQDRSGSTLNDVVLIEIEAASEQVAIARAMALLQRNCYRVMQVREGSGD